MKEISLNEQKKIQLEMLVDFANFCDENNITYYLSGGTLLGAIRHKGFIPWDDDIDIMMPREDYERALKMYKHEIYEANNININKECWIILGRISNNKTYLKGNWKDKYKESVYIDIFPLDGLPDNKFFQKLIFFIEQIFILCQVASVMKYSVTKKYADKNAGVLNWKIYFRTIIKYILITLIGKTKPQFWIKIVHKIATMKSFYKSNFMGCLIIGNYGTKEIMPKEVFKSKIQVDFEGYKFWAPIGYDCYLKSLYGDYMKLPPVEKRQSHHDFKAYWKE
ncbi:phosphorylcholine transferase LicD [Megamonas hypermegale]|uniref:LicD family protein n=1 Tax=Megamonas hypermegale TaxID=158847 RepID=UPI0026EC5B1F|nr:LicD family protein [Megamonas hypermegale]